MQRILWTMGVGMLTAMAWTTSVAIGDEASKPIWVEDFDGLDDNAREDKGDTAWTLAVKDPGGTVGVKGEELYMEYTLEEVVWTSAAIDISSAESVAVTVNVRGEGTIDDDPGTEDHFRVFAKIDGGKEVLLGKLEGYLDQEKNTVTKGELKGKSLVLVIRAMTSGDDEIWVVEKVAVNAE